MAREVWIGASWKMNNTLAEAHAFAELLHVAGQSIDTNALRETAEAIRKGRDHRDR